MKKYKKMTIDELETFRDEQQTIIDEAREKFTEAGKVLDAKRQLEDTSIDDLEAQIAELETKKVKLSEVQ